MYLVYHYAGLIRRAARIAGAMLALFVAIWSGTSLQAGVRNVLFIAVDDLRCELGAYGSSFIKTPNLDRLAAEGTFFKQSYCQIPLCGPSRASLMTGRYPETLKMFDNSRSWRDRNPDAVSLAQHFKNHGYSSIAAGKIYHNGLLHLDDASWSDPNIPFWANSLREDYRNQDSLITLAEMEEKVVKAGASHDIHMESLPVVPPYENQQVADEETTDGRIAQFGMEQLQRFRDSGEPFFLALGFHKPHLSFNAPEKYWDLYDRDALPSAPNLNVPEEYFKQYYNSWYIRQFKNMPKEGPFPKETAKTLRHAYFACVSFVDAQIGKVLDELKRLGLDNDTLVVLWGDHGYLLNDHGVFGKHNHFEQALRAPLIVSVPKMKQAGVVSGPVEFIDIYPTVCELVGMPIPDGVQGRSQVKALLSGDSVRNAAYSVYGNPNGVFSRSIRTKQYRYIEWVRNGRREHQALFDYQTDPQETRNLIDEVPYEQTVKVLENEILVRVHEAVAQE